jgi:hypothetical protein
MHVPAMFTIEVRTFVRLQTVTVRNILVKLAFSCGLGLGIAFYQEIAYE